MSKTGKIVLLVVGGCVVLLVAGGTILYRQFGAGLKTAVAEGELFGATTDNAGCFADALARDTGATSVTRFSRDIMHLAGCLEASRPSPNLCT